MKMTHTLTLNKDQLSALLMRFLQLPNGTRIAYNLATVDERDSYQTFGSVALSYETELENVPNFEGSSAKR